MSGPGAIACIGGGGFLVDDQRGLQERHLLTLLRAPRRGRPRVLYLGLAHGDAEGRQLRAFRMFTALGCDLSVLPFFPYEMKRDYAAEALAADLIYVGGGNTPAMIAVWREFGFDRALHAAWRAGAVLSGVSAGANCWFEDYVTDSVPGGGVRAGLGWLPGTFCPHLDSEPWRAPLLAGVTRAPAYGVREGGMMIVRPGAAPEFVADKPGVTANLRLPGEPAREVPSLDLSSR
ncbi:MAG TPA: Type 1 glutamine amidotransferase-like domain-containing protein [Burkholderiaceae bacterium]|jgi:peptidase E|nr:Type 1 glutamine amidotransferase-like domain-containing protein [Burkholderiaceae bacterium]